ncbi:MAG: hypothetical protein LQ343_000023 [Gyalolechia ehrenbergii]|nr:MAG: hypothetical protein LQ343_000023 [Gyalolechia ehrenbergii]
MSHRVKSCLPIIDGGDVEIRLSRKDEDRLVLPSSVLKLHLPWFSTSLSKPWTTDEQHEHGPVQWQYELELDGGEFPFLIRRQSTASVTPDQSLNSGPDFYLCSKNADMKALTEKQIETYNGWVQAYKSFFNVLFLEDLGIACKPHPGQALRCLHRTIQVADMYLNPKLMKMPAQLFIQDNVPKFQDAMLRKVPILLEICDKYEFDTFAKDTICHLVGDETRDDAQIRKELDADIAELVLEKRTRLRKMMIDVDLELLTCETLWGKNPHEAYMIGGAGCFREYVAGLLRSPKQRYWKMYAQPYRKLVADNGTMDQEHQFRNYRFRNQVIAHQAQAHFSHLQIAAVKIVEPLFQSTFKWLKPREDYPEDIRWRGFSCIEITDEDLPWNQESSE